MKRVAIIVILAVALIAAVALGMLAGCGEKDVPVYSDEDRIIELLTHNYDAKELFRQGGFFTSTPYTVPFDSAVITDRHLKTKREINIEVSDNPVDHGYLGYGQEADVRVYDHFTIEVTRAYSADTLIDTITVSLGRYAFLMQLGEVTRPYAGWVLWSMTGDGAQALWVESSSGITFGAPLDTARLAKMASIPRGSRLLVTTTWTGDSAATCHLLSDYAQGGLFMSPMHWYYDTKNYDSLSYLTPTSNPRIYNLLMVQTLSKATFPNRLACVVIPYKVE